MIKKSLKISFEIKASYGIEREKFYPGTGLELGSLALRARALTAELSCPIEPCIYSALYFTVARSAEGRPPARLHCPDFSASVHVRSC